MPELQYSTSDTSIDTSTVNAESEPKPRQAAPLVLALSSKAELAAAGNRAHAVENHLEQPVGWGKAQVKPAKVKGQGLTSGGE